MSLEKINQAITTYLAEITTYRDLPPGIEKIVARRNLKFARRRLTDTIEEAADIWPTTISPPKS